jgi:lysophospholipase L1-like esterase
LQNQYGNGGVGWVDLYYLSTVQPGVTIGAAGTWISQRQTASSTGLNISDVRTRDVATPARITVSVTANVTSATLYYYNQPGGGSFQWWVDSTTPIVINTEGTAGIGISTVTGLSNSAAHTFQLQITSAGSAGIAIDGLDLRSGTSGVVVHNLGSAGSDTNTWVNVNASLWESQLASINPSLVIIMLSPNDQADGISVSKQYTNLTGLINRIRSSVPGIPIILAPPPDNGLNRTPSMSEFNASQSSLAKTAGVGYIDVFDDMGPFNSSYFNSDLLHPNVLGGEMISGFILDGIDKYMSYSLTDSEL